MKFCKFQQEEKFGPLKAPIEVSTIQLHDERKLSRGQLVTPICVSIVCFIEFRIRKKGEERD